MKPYNVFSGDQPARRIPMLQLLVSIDSRRRDGWAGVGSPNLRAYPFVQQMARIGPFWRNQKPAAEGRSETMFEIGVDRSRQSESLSGGAPSGGGGGRGRGVRNDFILDGSELSGGAPSGGGGGRGRGVRNDFILDGSELVSVFGESLLPELGSGDGEGFRGVAVNASHPEHPLPIAASPLSVDAPVGSASVGGAIAENTGIGFATNSNRGSSPHQHDGGGSEGHSSLFDPYDYDVSKGQLSLGDWSSTDDVMNDFLVFLGGSAGEPP